MGETTSSHASSRTASARVESRRHVWFRQVRRKIGSALLPFAAPALLRGLSRTWRYEELARENYEQALGHPGRIFLLWHGRMLLPLVLHRGRGYRVLVSPSDDGSLVTGTLGAFGYGIIRGSSNKRPAKALREMLGTLLEGGTIILTPDGPRGPRHSMNVGPAWLASATGYPVLGAGLACDRSWRLDSWDRFAIPKPGARVVVHYGEPMFLPRQAGEAELAAASDELRRRLIASEEACFRRLGVEPDW